MTTLFLKLSFSFLTLPDVKSACHQSVFSPPKVVKLLMSWEFFSEAVKVNSTYILYSFLFRFLLRLINVKQGWVLKMFFFAFT